MREVKVNVKFQKSHNGADTSETYKVIQVDVEFDVVTLEVERVFNNETWTTKRKTKWSKIQEDFHNNLYQYQP